ncbi:laccase domain-containing protein, partial [Acinetobacter baumannii]
MPAPLTADILAGLPNVRHGFFTRQGGVSGGIYASLNCGLGSNDDTSAVIDNRARVAAHLCPGQTAVLTVHQTHS